MRVGSLFSGIGGFDLGLERAGMEVVWQVEKDRQARSVLRRHWPEMDLYEDVCDVGGVRLDSGRERGHGASPDDGNGVRVGADDQRNENLSGSKGGNNGSRPRSTLAPVDIICGGFPCQDLSVAGKRAGLDGARSGLWHEFHRIVAELAPTWVLIENVPGLLSSNDGRDMAVIVRGLAQLGYVGAWRVLDSQYAGVAQRRRRVFMLACNDPRAGCPAEVLAIAEGVSGHPAPSREAGADVTGSLTGGARSSSCGNPDDNRAQAGFVIAHALTARFDSGEDGTGRGTPIVAQCHGSNVGPMGHLRSGNGHVTGGVPFVFDPKASPSRPQSVTEDMSPTLESAGQKVPAVFRKAQKAHDSDDCERWEEAEHSNTLAGHGTTTSEVVAQSLAVRGRDGVPQAELGDDGKANAILTPNGGRAGIGAGAVLHTVPRRLTPRECERLQGFPDDWTRRTDDGTELADSPRYRMLGNAVTVNVAHWIGTRLMESLSGVAALEATGEGE